MMFIGALFIVIAVAAGSLAASATVYVTVGKRPDESRNYSSLDPNYCTTRSQKCYEEINELGAKLSSVNSLSLYFEKNSGQFLLHTLLAFHNYTKLELHGTSYGKTVIKCVNKGNNDLGSGLTFINVSNFIASNIIFKSCTHAYKHSRKNHEHRIIWSALLFDTCSNVQLTSVIVKESTGFGVSMFNVVGNVQFEFCSFKNNSAKGTDSGGGALYLEMDNTSRGMYKLLNCTFVHNVAHTSIAYPKEETIRTFGQGGGLLISLRGNASNNQFRILDCKFINNSAVWGGGLHIFLTDSSYRNTIVVGNTRFEGNRATAGGGGMVVYIMPHNSLSENNISVYKSNFRKNQAEHQGGGIVIHTWMSRESKFDGINYLRFEQCNWIANSARYSAAVDITTRKAITSIVPVFSNCNFTNHNMPKPAFTSQTYKGINVRKAAFIVLDSRVKFENMVNFTKNAETALYAISSKIEFAAKTRATFSHNRGSNGGAIALIGSFLFVGDNSQLNFTKNKAFEFGGAIYSETQGETKLHHSSNCFIQCNHCQTVMLIFMNNKANSRGKELSFGRAIFASSLLSCVSEGFHNTTNVSIVLHHISNFVFKDSNPYDEVVTSATKFTLSKKPGIESDAIPGKEFDVPVVATDCFGHKLQSNYKAYIHQQRNCRNGSHMVIDAKYIYMPTNKLKLYGNPGAVCNITIEKKGKQVMYLNIQMSIAHCPPGFILAKVVHNISQ